MSGVGGVIDLPASCSDLRCAVRGWKMVFSLQAIVIARDRVCGGRGFRRTVSRASRRVARSDRGIAV